MRIHLRLCVAVIVVLLVNPLLGYAEVTPSLIPNRTGGIAPLSVHFNASLTSSTLTTNPFHDLHYEWRFDDDDGSTWRTGQSRNVDYNPIAGHVFEQAGTYNVTLTITDVDGSTATDSVVISVADPDVVFAPITVCIAQDSSNWSGAPFGSSLLVVPDDDTIMSAIANQISLGMRRVLLRRGDIWSTTGSLGISNVEGPGIVGAFGSGEKPILHDTHPTGNYLIVLDGSGLNYGAGEVYDWRVMDLMLWGETVSGGAEHTAIGSVYSPLEDQPANMLIMNIDVYNFHSAISIESDEAAIVNCRVVRLIGVSAGGGSVSWVSRSNKLLFLGNQYDGAVEYARATEHLLRVSHTNDSVFSHNFMLRSGRAAMKIHALHNDDGSPPSYDMYSKRLVFADNYIDGGVGVMSAQTVTIAPQADTYDERLEDVIFERNYFEESPLVQTHLVIAATNDVTVRNNIFNSLLGGSFAASIGRRGTTFNVGSNDVRVHNNTGITSTAGAFCVLDSAGYANNVDLFNNIVESPGGAAPIVTWSGDPPDFEVSNNLATADAGFVSPLPSPLALPSADAATASLAEWIAYASTPINWSGQTECVQITDASDALDAGLTLATVRKDFAQFARPQGAGHDIGAFEYAGGIIFADDFESGALTAWSFTVP